MSAKFVIRISLKYVTLHDLLKHWKAMIRKMRNQKEIPTAKKQGGKNLIDN